MTKNILFLYAELVPNLIVLLRQIRAHGYDVHVVYWDSRKKTPYHPESDFGIKLYPKSEFTRESLKKFALGLDPAATYIAGWMDHDYLTAAWNLRRKKYSVVTGFDDWWKGTLRQRFGSLLMRAFKTRFFSHAWISGYKQYEYAKKMGFHDSEIITDLLSCDFDLFSQPSPVADHARNGFVFVGRFSKEKGIAVLVQGYIKYRALSSNPWSLLCVGNGSEDQLLNHVAGITMMPFSSQAEVKSMLQRCGAFVLPSNRDYSPLVVHEAISTGCPLILSTGVGNRFMYLIPGANGFLFDKGDSDQLAKRMLAMELLQPGDRAGMAVASRRLSLRNHPLDCANSFLSAIPDIGRDTDGLRRN